ncbi:MAG: sugar phosphate nucleotidyltransferase [Stellaceae bacterium]
MGLTAVILAGGRGTRLAAVCANVPKPMLPVLGRPFLHWVSAWLIDQGVRDLVFAAGHLGEQIEQWLVGLPPEPGLRLRCRRETAALGTGGAARNCLDLCGPELMVLNGDSLLLSDLAPALTRFEDRSLDGVLIATRSEDSARYGSLVLGPDGLLAEFAEKGGRKGLINGGIYIFRRHLLESLPADRPLSMEYDVIPGALRSGARLDVVTVDAPFIDIGTPETLALAEAFIARHRRYFPSFLAEEAAASGATESGR